MILQSLHRLYDRLVLEPEYAVASTGYSLQRITFEVVLSRDGSFEIRDMRTREGKKFFAQQMLVPGQAKPSGSGLNPCFLWDNPGYLLGYKPDDPKPERTAEASAAFRERHLALEAEIGDDGFSAVCRFLENWNPADAARFPELSDYATGFGVFRLQGETGHIHERPAIVAWWNKQASRDGEENTSASDGDCLITGRRSRIAALHEPAIKGVAGSQAGGAKLVSFNCDAFISYGKQQSANAPVSEEAAFRYCTALNAVLSGPRSGIHRISIGDATAVFWTAKRTRAEGFLAQLFSANPSEAASAQDPAALQTIRSLLEALRNGGGALTALGDNPGTEFFILGLAPNAARLSVRFWHSMTLGAFFDKLKSHYDALRIVRQWDDASKRPDYEFPPFWLLLRQTGRESKDIPPLLGGALMRAVLTGGPYPAAMAMAVINRIRADREINHPRAAFLKAWLTRLPNPSHSHSIPMSLDPERKDPAYRLGRLFAILEKTQQDALGDVNAGIRDRFYSAASATPSTVFPRLLKTYAHHLGKLSPGAKIAREKLMQETMESFHTFPRFLPLNEQALFAIGYYHQRKDLFTKRETATEEPVS